MGTIRALLYIACFLVVVVAIFALPKSISFWKQRQRQQALSVPRVTTFPMRVHDVTDREITIQRRPSRIISLAPAVTEILFAIGAGDQLVAGTSYCVYPEAAKLLPRIGGYLDPNIEKIISMKPDLVIGMRGSKREVIDRLYAMGIPIVVVDPARLVDISHAVELIGRVTGNNEKATEMIHTLTRRQKAVATRLAPSASKPRPKTLFLFALDGLNSAGPGSFIDDVITAAGGENIASMTGTAWPQLSMETVTAANPQVILIAQMTDDHHLTSAQALKALQARSNWRSISAVRSGKVYLLDSDVTLPGPRLIDRVEKIAELLHPECFQQ